MSGYNIDVKILLIAAFALYFSGDEVTDATVAAEVKANREARSVKFYKTPNVSDACFKSFANLSSLEAVKVICTNMTGTGIQHIAKLPKLKTLEFEDSPGLKYLPTTNITSANFYDSDTVDDACAWYIGYANTLEYVNLSNTHITDKGLGYIAKSPTTKWLYLLNTRITDASVPLWKKFPNLELLDLRQTNIGPATLNAVAALPKLKHVLLNNELITETDIAKFKAKRPDVIVDLPSR